MGTKSAIPVKVERMRAIRSPLSAFCSQPLAETNPTTFSAFVPLNFPEMGRPFFEQERRESGRTPSRTISLRW